MFWGLLRLSVTDTFEIFAQKPDHGSHWQGHDDVYNQEEENTGNRPKSIKEMEEEKAAEKAAQQK